MRDLKNPELRRELLLYCLMALVCGALGLLVSPAAALFGAGALLAGGLLHGLFQHRRYKELAELSRSVDRILHNQDQLLDDSAEGELAILRSEIRKMTVQLRESADLLQRDKQTLSQALADISHQLRTPLTSMNLTVSLLPGAAEEDQRLRLTRELKRSLERIDWLVETLLKLSKLDAGVVRFEPEPLTAAALTERAMRNLRIPMELRDQKLVLDLSDAALTADPAWTAEALGNILKNCVEHTPAGGTLTVTARQTPIYTELAVTDTGPGLDPEDLPRLFERFYRGKDANENSIGIGLALARQIIAAQNGTVQAANNPAGGAKFTVRFYAGTV
ncbi:MAG: HAMP domain-containing histidine kinase [Oscillospiraceae bacterium]|nr:HAMP domain-containing histidine kinase [Oscillospiraceae bacterium]